MLKKITLVAVANLIAVTLGLGVAQASNYNQSYRFDHCYDKHHGYSYRYHSPYYGYGCYIWGHKHRFTKWH